MHLKTQKSEYIENEQEAVQKKIRGPSCVFGNSSYILSIQTGKKSFRIHAEQIINLKKNEKEEPRAYLFRANTMRNTTVSRTYAADAVSVYMSKVYLWMSLGLILTAITAWFVGNSEAVLSIVNNSLLLILLCVGELGLVIALSAAIHKMSAQTATLLFLLFSFLNGLTLSSIFLVYSDASIANAFLSTAGMFFAMSIYGTVTKRDLSSLGSFLFMGLIGLIIASLVNIFLGNAMMDLIISCIGVLIFTLYTAYDTQQLRIFGSNAPMDDNEAIQRGAILGALTLYLDFINLFIYLLRLFAQSRD